MLSEEVALASAPCTMMTVSLSSCMGDAAMDSAVADTWTGLRKLDLGKFDYLE